LVVGKADLSFDRKGRHWISGRARHPAGRKYLRGRVPILAVSQPSPPNSEVVGARFNRTSGKEIASSKGATLSRRQALFHGRPSQREADERDRPAATSTPTREKSFWLNIKIEEERRGKYSILLEKTSLSLSRGWH